MTTYVPCTNPTICGVIKHRAGSQSHKECQARSGKDARPTSFTHLAPGTASTSSPDKVKANAASSDMTDLLHGPIGHALGDSITIKDDPTLPSSVKRIGAKVDRPFEVRNLGVGGPVRFLPGQNVVVTRYPDIVTGRLGRGTFTYRTRGNEESRQDLVKSMQRYQDQARQPHLNWFVNSDRGDNFHFVKAGPELDRVKAEMDVDLGGMTAFSTNFYSATVGNRVEVGNQVFESGDEVFIEIGDTYDEEAKVRNIFRRPDTYPQSDI